MACTHEASIRLPPTRHVCHYCQLGAWACPLWLLKSRPWSDHPAGSQCLAERPPSRVADDGSVVEWRKGKRTEETRSLLCARQPSVIGLGASSMGGRDGPEPTLCGQAECFDRLLRLCVACNLFRTPEPSPAASASSPATGTALQPQESVGAGAVPQGALPMPGLLFGAPALLGLALALGLVGLLSWRRRRRGAAPLEAPDRDRNGTPDNVIILSPGPIDATTPVWSPPEDPATTPPGHSVPVPATELGSTELVTTKTAGPEQP
ncbi:tumor necrosis factor receptor superfamily member 13C [Dugong dugon]